MEGGLLVGVSVASYLREWESEMMVATQWVKGIFNLHAVSRV